MSYAQGGGRIQAVRNGVNTNSPLKRERNPFCVLRGRPVLNLGL